MSGKQQEGSNKKEKGEKEKFPGYPLYPQGEDIYNQNQEESEIDPEFPDRKKGTPVPPDSPNENNFSDKTGGDLDIPGSELDDQQEDIGSEDEENNYYSLGGDEKESQEENTGRD